STFLIIHLTLHSYECLDYSEDDINVILITNDCHRTGVWKCGHRFVRAYKFLNVLSEEQSFDSKCSLRTAFFECLDMWSKAKRCPKHKTYHSQHFRQHLTETLWSTRGCLTGHRE
ncbi:uncharacterized protein LOC128966513, partial [Oppia nitens]|uniref:uncharacterized protein LOC128966513 n=1 Tax=Oppia nitens TaxID=1686743 RepID=UPI0023DC3EE5